MKWHKNAVLAEVNTAGIGGSWTVMLRCKLASTVNPGIFANSVKNTFATSKNRD